MNFIKPMKIAYIMTNYPTGGYTFITNQITGLLDFGHDVRIFALASGNVGLKLHEDIIQYDLLNRLEYHGKPKSRIKEFKSIAKDFTTTHPSLSFGNLVQSLNYKKFGKRSVTLSAYFALRTFKKHLHFDIINPHCGYTAINYLFLKSIFKSAAFVSSFHGADFSQFVRQNGVDIYRYLFELSDLITAQSYYSRDCLISIGCPPRKIIKHPNGIDTEKFSYKPRGLAHPDERINLVIVARLVEKKGHNILLRSFAKVASRHKNVILNIIGDGPGKIEIERMISQNEVLRDKVILHGFMTQEKVISLLDKCHIFVHPSITTMRWADQEDTTTVLMEAQAMGLPVISTYHAGIPEVVIDGKTGFLVPERNERALTEAIERMIIYSHEWDRIGKAGRENVEKNFNIRILNKKLEYVFYKLKSLQAGEYLGIESSEEINHESV